MAQEMIHLFSDAIAAIWRSQLPGLIVGLFAARYWQVKQWKLDAKKTEYKELLGTLSKSARCLINCTFQGGPIVMNPEGQRQYEEADVAARSTIEDRIFIAVQIQNENILERWQLMAGEKDASRLSEYWKDMQTTLIRLAHNDG